MGDFNREPSPLSEFRRVKMDANFREWGEGRNAEFGMGKEHLMSNPASL